MKEWFFILSLCLGTLSYARLVPKLNDFAYSMKLNLQEKSKLYQFNIPFIVYQHIIQPNLGDIRIFNKLAHPVPYAIRNQKLNKILKLEKLKYYPQQNISKIKLLDSNLKQSSAFVIDLSPLVGKKIRNIDFKWQSENGIKIFPVMLSISNDLIHWEHMNKSFYFANDNFHDTKIISHSLDLHYAPAKYLLLSAKNVKFSLSKVTAAIVNQSPPAFEWVKLATNYKNKALYITLQKPMKFYHLRLKDKNQYFNTNVIVYNKDTNSHEWQEVTKSSIYNLKINGVNVQKKVIILQGSKKSRDWKIFSTTDSLKDNEVYLSWLPDKIVFYAEGDKPYLLTFASGLITNNAIPFPRLLAMAATPQSDINIGLAIPHSLTNLAGKSALVNTHQQHFIKWKMWSYGILAIVIIIFLILGWCVAKRDHVNGK